jgi:hypothetical protein
MPQLTVLLQSHLIQCPLKLFTSWFQGIYTQAETVRTSPVLVTYAYKILTSAKIMLMNCILYFTSQNKYSCNNINVDSFTFLCKENTGSISTDMLPILKKICKITEGFIWRVSEEGIYYLYFVSIAKYQKLKQAVLLHHYYHRIDGKKHCLFGSYSSFNRYVILMILSKGEVWTFTVIQLMTCFNDCEGTKKLTSQSWIL